MKKLRIHKWIEGIAPDASTRKAAVRTLKARLGAVEHYLPLAAKKAVKDVEYVHSLRMWTRRATSALELYDELLPRKQAAWFKKQLKRIRHAAGDARDYDVLAGSLEQDSARQALKPCLKKIYGLREKAQNPLITIHKKLKRDDRFDRQLKNLLRRIERNSEANNPHFGKWSHAKLQPIVKNFFEAIPGKDADLAALHRFRIRGKELRYAMELLAGAFPSDFRQRLYPIVETVQDRLGKINDLATAREHLQQLLDDTSNATEKRHQLRLIAQEQTCLEQAHREFLAWCAPHLDILRTGFSTMLQPKLTGKSEKHKTTYVRIR